jgi:uncharacterized repeat protein (TIGR01451 family)
MEIGAAGPLGGSAPAAPLSPPSVSMDGGTAPAAPPSSEAGRLTPTTPPAQLFPAGSPTGLETPGPLVPVPPSGPVAPTGPQSPAGPAATTTPAAPTVTAGAASENPTGKPTVTSLAPPPPSALPGRVVQHVVLEAVCPETVVFGQEFRYELIVRNMETVAVAGIRVDDELPPGAKYVSSDPPAELNGDRLSWTIGTLAPRSEKRIMVRVKPSDEGEVRSRASVTYTATVDARSRVTRPRLAVAVTGSEVCRAGEETTFQIKVSNSGTGPAQRMVLQAKLSDGLLHPQGVVIEAELANLPPNDTKVIPLKVRAAKAGLQRCEISVLAEGSPDATGKASVNVVEPLLQISQTGPVKCHVRAEPVYEISLSNPGTAATDPITLSAVLPDGFEFVQGSDNASFAATTRAVVWKLTGLAPGGSKSVAVKLRAVAAGDGVLKTQAQAMPETPTISQVGANVPVRTVGRALEATTETSIKAEGVAAIRFEVTDLEDPVEVGKEAVYEVRVTNQGTGACSNIQLVAALGEGMSYTGSNGPTQIKTQGQHLVFDPIQTLAAKGQVVYQVRVRGATAGDLRFRVQLTCDQVRTPVVKEESTRFYKE